MINTFKQMNYSEYKTENFNKYESELEKIIEERKIIENWELLILR